MTDKERQLLTDLHRHLNNCRGERATLNQEVMQLRIANEALRRELAQVKTEHQRLLRQLETGD